ncbi:hypothetical protein [Nocardia sp. NPDC051750]
MTDSIAFCWIDYEVSTAPEWDQAQVRRLADRLGYSVVWRTSVRCCR